MKNRILGQKIGFLGGGQLARMMALRAHDLGLEIHVLCPDKNEPAAQVCQHWHQGDPHRKEDLQSFFAKVDVVTCESEFYNGDLLNEVKLMASRSLQLHPSAEIIAELQDRWTQKTSFSDNSMPTSPFLLIKDKDTFQAACDLFKYNVVFKKRLGGYDGYGTFILKSKKDAQNILSEIENRNFHFIAEKFISFKRELACVFVRDQFGKIFSYPLVETHQKNSKCDWVRGPVKHPRWPKMKSQIEKWLKKKKYLGVIAFEFFDTGKELLINESAPRVHNSGHYTQQAFEHDQFEMHVRAVCGLPLPQKNLQVNPAFTMVNLIGESENQMQIPQNISGHLHWYGKEQNRKGRKMGHINYLGKKSEALLKIALKERRKIQL